MAEANLNHSKKTDFNSDKFDQAVVLKQSPVWSRAILWTIMGVATFGVAPLPRWASQYQQQLPFASWLLFPSQ